MMLHPGVAVDLPAGDSGLRVAGLGLAEFDGKDVEILILRHQLAVAQRRDPRLARKLTWADRAWPVPGPG